jgi:Arc/MetJ-type ribon-helix-helix transcriptional regulator
LLPDCYPGSIDDVKLSVSLPEEDVARLDAYARATGLRSRSAALQHAIRMLQTPTLAADYAQAWQEWESSGEADVWAATGSDGLGRAPW